MSTIVRYSILPALSLDGVLYCHIVEGSFNGKLFFNFIRGLLDQMQPYPAPNSVIVMDNCRIHHNPLIREMIETRCVCWTVDLLCVVNARRSGMRLEYLPAYSPDFNPIEQAFSVIKNYVRRHYNHFARANTTGTSPRDDSDAHQMLLKAVFSVTSSDAHGFFKHSGYL
jgi:hypothetical protein